VNGLELFYDYEVNIWYFDLPIYLYTYYIWIFKLSLAYPPRLWIVCVFFELIASMSRWNLDGDVFG